MTDEPAPDDQVGTVMRNMREDDRVLVWLDGKRIGEIFVARVPHDLKIRVGFSFERRFKISHLDAEAKP